MGRGHGERLDVGDATFLRIESPTEHMHTAGLFIFDPPREGSFEFSRFVELVRSRLHLVPRFRQKLAFPPLNVSTPIWVDDEQFDLSYHVRHAALPDPGSIHQLTDYVSRLISRQLDRARPLWELYVIEGLEDGRVAYLGKTHHAMIDGVTGIDIATLLLDQEEDPGVTPPPRSWHPSSTPPDWKLAMNALREQVASPQTAVRSIRHLARTPGRAVRRAMQVGEGIISVASSVSPAPVSPLNTPNGSFRRFAIQRLELEDAKVVKEAFGTTVNDVVLAVVGDAVGRFLRNRGDRTRGLEMRVMVPVSVRAPDGDDALFGNRVSSVFVPLPVDEMDPTERLRIVHDAMKDVKDRKQAVGAEFLMDLSGYAPPTIHALGARVASRTRLYNLVVTNVPGPQVPLYSMGMRLLGAFPVTPLTQNRSLAVGVTSIDGWLNFGLTGDWDSLPDLENLTAHLADALAELVEHASAVGTRSELARRPTHVAGPGPESGTGGSSGS